MIWHISNKDKLLNNFFNPLSKITDSVVLNIEEDVISTLITTSDNTIIVNAKHTEKNNKSSKKLNIPDIKKLCRIFQCIPETTFDLTLNSNNISYVSDNIRFKYHLYDEGIINTPKLNLSKLEKLEYTGSFDISYNSISALVKGSTIATDTDKIYIMFKNDTVVGELTDFSRDNTDSYGLQISDNYEGQPIQHNIPLNFEIFRIISSMKFNNIHTRIASQTGVFTFDVNLEDTSLKFIVSALAK